MESLQSIIQSNNDIDNVAKTINNNVNDNVTEFKVNHIAQTLTERLNNPSGRLFYCKVGWSLPESKIWTNLEIALEKGKDPKKYFSWLCKKDMQ